MFSPSLIKRFLLRNRPRFTFVGTDFHCVSRSYIIGEKVGHHHGWVRYVAEQSIYKNQPMYFPVLRIQVIVNHFFKNFLLPGLLI